MIIRVEAEIADLVPEYLANRRLDLARISELIRTGGIEEIRRIGHQMKGTGSSYGLEEITDIGAAVEQAAKASDVSALERCADRLRRFLSEVEVISE